MTRTLACMGGLILLCGVGFAQGDESAPRFDIADIHGSDGRAMKGPFVGGGRYEIRAATMLELIRTAYGVDNDKIYGGPSWLELDRFEVIARLPPGTNAEMRKNMLQGLLADRFHLAVHNDTKPMPAYALLAGKHAGLKEADPAGETGCKTDQQRAVTRMVSADGQPPSAPVFVFNCHKMTMAAFAEQLRGMIGAAQYLGNKRVVDQTELKGSWDFSLQYSLPIRGGMVDNSDNISLLTAVDKQLGLKLEPVSAPMAVLVVDGANRQPTANSPEALKSLPPPPAEFDVVEIKPSQPGQNNPLMGMNGVVTLNGQPMMIQNGRIVQPIQNGRVNLPGFTLKQLIQTAWDATDDTLTGLPKFAETDRYDVIAKIPGTYEGGADMDTIRPMLRTLLTDRFKITFHKDERPGTAYSLTAVKPKLKPADPAARTKCQLDTSPTQMSSMLRTFNCTNMTMAQFAAWLSNQGMGYVSGPVHDDTGLEGAWDFQIGFSPGGTVLAGGRGRTDSNGGPAASDPSGGVSLFDALSKQLGMKLEQQKRQAPVTVIDHVEPKPIEN